MPPAPKRLGTPLIELHQVDSTNNYATALAHAGLAEAGTAVLAAFQTAGKGQRHKSWTGAAGENIALSLLLRPEGLQTSDFFRFSMAVALGVQRFFTAYAGDETFVKWPNDLYWRDRKAGGILIENILSGPEWKWAVVGIGININQADFGDLGLRAVSLRQITGREWPVKELALALCSELETALEELAADPSGIEASYHKVLYKYGETARFRKGNRVFDAEVLGVTSNGSLRLLHGVEEHYPVGDIEWVF